MFMLGIQFCISVIMIVKSNDIDKPLGIVNEADDPGVKRLKVLTILLMAYHIICWAFLMAQACLNKTEVEEKAIIKAQEDN